MNKKTDQRHCEDELVLSLPKQSNLLMRIAIFFLFSTLFSCENKFPDYTQKEENVYMKLLSFEESSKRIKQKGFGAISIEIYEGEKLLYKHYKEERINLENNKFDFLTKHLELGDSCEFLIPTEKIVTVFKPLKLEQTSADYLSVFIKFDDFYTSKEDKEMVEQVVLKKYLGAINAKPKAGIYIEEIKTGTGTGKEIEKGDEITIAYKGYFINGLEFDNISGRTAFTFAYGSQGQVIKGLNIAIKGMIEGQKTKIIIPSQLAFGEVGSTTLIVPPYTTVVYELEIIKVN